MINLNNTPKDLVNDFKITEHVFNRYNININSDLPIKAFHNAAFIKQALNCFIDHKNIDLSVIHHFSIGQLTDYLIRSHQYYLNKRLPEIEQEMVFVISEFGYNGPLLKVILNFLLTYKKELLDHFTYEETHLFPYAVSLDKVKDNPERLNTLMNYSTKVFLDFHDHTEEIELSELKKELLKYKPAINKSFPYNVMLEKLHTLEIDLYVHSVIEEEVLVPKLIDIEKHLSL